MERVRTKLKDITLLITDGKHGDCNDQESSGYYFISCKDVANGLINYENARQITQKDFEDTDRRTNLQANDIVITNSGTIGRMAIVKDVPITRKTTFQKSVAIIKPDIQKVLPQYLYYNLQYNVVYLINNSVGSAQKNLLLSTLREFALEIHKTSRAQQKIASILSAYDNLIENNNKRIRLLERMAENLYKEWFVRFRFPGHENAEFENGLPKGWGMERIGNVCETIGGGTPSTSKTEYWNGGIKWVTPSDITSKNSLPLLKVEVSITEEGLKNSSAKLLPPYTILMTSRASIGFFGVAPFEVCTNQGFISIIPQNDNLRMYMLYMLKSRKDEIIANANGSTFLEISKGRFRKMKMVVPSNIILDLFENKTRTIFDETLKLEQQNTTLTRQRDLLLPRLMSGKLEVNI